MLAPVYKKPVLTLYYRAYNNKGQGQKLLVIILSQTGEGAFIKWKKMLF